MRWILILAFLLMIGCTSSPPVYTQPPNTSAIINETVASDPIKVCGIEGTPYYFWDYFIYVKNSKNESMVMTWIGTYTYDKVKGNWNLLPFINREDNVYWDTLQWVKDGQLPHGTPVVCSETPDVPKIFYKFYKSYKPVYDRVKRNDTASSFF